MLRLFSIGSQLHNRAHQRNTKIHSLHEQLADTRNGISECPVQDATSSIDTLRGLSRLAGSGMSIITVIHQPRYSVYELFDSVLLLGVGGVAVYNGPPLLTAAYFTRNGFALPPNENIADWNLDVISGCGAASRIVSPRGDLLTNASSAAFELTQVAL